MTNVSGKLSGISASAATQAIVRQALESTPTASRGVVRDLFARAAGSDRNRHLSASEAALVHGALVAGDLEAARVSVDAQLAAIASGHNVDGIKSYFTSTTDDFAPILIQAMRDTVAAAAGKPVELHAMIFAFTEKSVADALLALVKENPNVELRIVTDFGQLTDSGDRQPTRIQRTADQDGVGDRVAVKYKKDTPYVWSTSLGRPVYSHAASKGLNHHKGMAMLIDGKPHKLVTGSYNWSKSGSDNYESLFVIDAVNAANRQLITDYQSEFTAFFNHPDTLGLAGTKAFKAKLFDELRVANGQPAHGSSATIPAGPTYAPRAPGATFDLNHLSDANYSALSALLKSPTTLGSIVHQYATYGAFTGWENLLERVPSLTKLPAERLAALRARTEFGVGDVPVQTATADELARSLKLSKTAALAIVAKREQLGELQSVADLRGLPGISEATFARIAARIDDDVGRAYFSARAVSDPGPTTGYAPANAAKTTPVLDADLEGVTAQPATLSSGVVDLIRRARPGDTVKIAQYGFSVGTVEMNEIVAAATRGVSFRVVLDKAGNSASAAALKAHAAAGLPIEVRLQKRTMHQKFGVVGDDAFFGSANFSNSASGKNSEDRFVVKNNAELSRELADEHDRLWAKSVPA
jgi:phosphatidylserine/phosphatidylglycerophosphate/cardiolipin synthase-like enzyme